LSGYPWRPLKRGENPNTQGNRGGTKERDKEEERRGEDIIRKLFGGRKGREIDQERVGGSPNGATTEIW